MKDAKYTFMPDMFSSMYFKTDEPMTGKLFKFQPDVMYSWKQYNSVSITIFSFNNNPILSTQTTTMAQLSQKLQNKKLQCYNKKVYLSKIHRKTEDP